MLFGKYFYYFGLFRIFIFIYLFFRVVALVCSLPTISAELTGNYVYSFWGGKTQLHNTNTHNTKLEKLEPGRRLKEEEPLKSLRLEMSGLIAVLLASMLLEACIAYVSTRGSVMHQTPRSLMPYLVYLRAGQCMLSLLALFYFLSCLLLLLYDNMTSPHLTPIETEIQL